MQISKHKVVTLDYTLTDDEGTVLDQSSNGQFAYLHGAHNIIPGLENALTDKSAGDALTVSVEPAQGYGERDDRLAQTVARDMFPPGHDISVGQRFHAQSPDGQPVVISVTAVNGDEITIDGNHPLAGKTLNFDVKVVDVREATDEEISHGHVHTHGHHHHD